MPSAKSAIENFVIDRIDYGSVKIRPMGVAVGDTMHMPDPEDRSGWAFVEAHSNTGRRYVVLSSPMGSAASLQLGGFFMVSLLYPHGAVWTINPMGLLTCGYVAEKFAHPMYPWAPDDLVCVTRAIALACGVEDDADTAHEYLEKQ